jgi:PAS domain S-box-containing protein
MPFPEEPNPFQILDFVPSGCCVIGEGGIIRFWNQTLETWTHRASADLLGRNLFEAFPALGQPRFKDRILSVMETGAPTLFSSALNPQFFPCMRQGGRPRIQQTALNRLPISNGGVMVLITVSDVTDQFERGEKYRAARAQALEEALVRKEREEQHRLIVSLTSSAIFIGDASEKILDCNASASRIFLYPMEEMLKLTLTELFPYKHAEIIHRVLAEDFCTGDQGLELEGKRQNGTFFPAEITAKFFLSGGERRFVVYIDDITDRRRAEEALSYARKQESLGSLAGGIAHDFNNLFGGVLGNLDLARNLIPARSPLLTYLDRIGHEMLRASELSQKMLALSGKGRFTLGAIDLNRLMEELKPKLSLDITKNATLSFRLADGLPKIEGDPMQIQQVVQYLVINASEALGSSEGLIDITTGLQDLDAETLRLSFPSQQLMPGPHVTLEVADTGCGISAESLPRIFDPFYSTKFAGRGLSLAVAQGILRAHKAGFSIASTVGVGTRFKLFFPIVPSAYPAAVSALPDESAAKGAVLFVDDEPVLREAAAEMLEMAGYEVITAEDGDRAVNLYIDHAPRIALVIMDLTMPRMDGRTAFQAILAFNPQAKVILSSGYSEHDAIQQFMSDGLVGFLPKPYRLIQLEELVRKFVKPSHERG